MLILGRAIKVGDNVDTDVILPGRYLILTEPALLGEHAMEGLDPKFTQKVKKNSILIAGRNFGCGSSREQAPIALKAAGVKCILAESFSRIFYRNAINIGLPILGCPRISEEVEEGDELSINLASGDVKNISKNVILQGRPLPKFILEIISNGGLIKHLKKEGKT